MAELQPLGSDADNPITDTSYDDPKPEKGTVFFKFFLGCLLFLLCVAIVAGFLAFSLRKNELNFEPSSNWTEIAKSLKASMNRSVDPCTDFYTFSCGGWEASSSIPSDRSRWSKASVIQEQVLQTLKDILSSKNWPLIGRLYSDCMDTTHIEEVGSKPLLSYFRLINELSNDSTSYKSKLSEALATLHKHQISAFFTFDVEPHLFNPTVMIVNLDQGGLSLPSREYYLNPNFGEIRNAFEIHVQQMFKLVDMSDLNSNAVLSLETILANFSRSIASRRDPYTLVNITSLTKLSTTYTFLDWPKYFSTLGVPDSELDVLNVVEPDYLSNLEHLFEFENVEALKTYLYFSVIRDRSRYLSENFLNESFAFRSKVYGVKSRTERWKYCVLVVQDHLGELLGRYYVLDAFPAQSKNYVRDLILRIEKSFESNIMNLDWMNSNTRQKAIQKLQAINNKVGYPDHYDLIDLEYRPLEFFENVEKSIQFAFDKDIRSLSKPVDKTAWLMNPYEVNAYYYPPLNEIVIPAGILKDPFYALDAPNALNYGGIGTVVGHELTHCLDDEGSQFDATGNLSNWWDPSVQQEFNNKSQCLVDYYSNYQVPGGLHVDGKLTLGENIADLGGVKEAFKAFEEVLALDKSMEENFARHFFGLSSRQLFFVAYAQNWCTLYRDEYLSFLVVSDPHSPAQFRVNGPLSNFDEFSRAFSCPVSSQMNPAVKCRIW
eukprot:TRINITY_DN6034_c0_g1_i1.p1 TRINITY_DN6034_c0_g1~~TRINITY_DN6034_c0_g1_i1.p1  ORF type:complete len:716 (+),score=112.07 TRINITY_DN6034_c0_g1_i1:59-2206(+)